MFINIMKCIYLAVTVAAHLASAPVTAAEEAPATLQGATLITAAQVRQLLEKGTLVVDTRVANEYAESHIKGAINTPYKEKSAKSVKFDMAQDSCSVLTARPHRVPASPAAGVEITAICPVTGRPIMQILLFAPVFELIVQCSRKGPLKNPLWK